MGQEFSVTAKMTNDKVYVTVSKGDAVDFSFDFSAWAEDNSAVTSAVWTVESGTAAISGQALVANVASALLTFSSAGRAIISVTAFTGTAIKKIWLEILARDYQCTDGGDYNG